MARETKLGLLVGLGFIICFAIILENRGRHDQVAPQMPHQLLAQSPGGSEATSPTAVQERARDYGRQAAGGSRGESGRREASPAATSSKNDQPGAARRGPGGRGQSERHASAEEPNPPREATEISSDGQPADTGRGLGEHRPGAADRFAERREVALAKSADQPAGGSTSGGPAADVRQASLTATPPAQEQKLPPPSATTGSQKPGQRYEVQQGDSLSRIAAQNYGSRSKRIIDAIFDANRATMSSPDALVVGQAIVLPEIEGVSPPTPVTADKAEKVDKPDKAAGGHEAAPTPSSRSEEYRAYQVKQGDRYVTIAKEQLGDASRWREIAELNHDIFPDPSKLRCGVRIRLPADSKAKQAG